MPKILPVNDTGGPEHNRSRPTGLGLKIGIETSLTSRGEHPMIVSAP